ncbi:substrate-binding domain-containing protein [Saccharothrix yanglingensis]|uniref:substrate-binding domain-containing protein n=1 Tax=Saccharothrix yanglingensis TaxID=659496 RepID=UPI0027D21ABF|nr:substrate-binding domain-containing protein [Saccharothrix yanglingensis]
MTTPEPSALLPSERRARLVELLRRRGTVRVHDLAGELDVSAITVRRDITLLADQGLVHRVRGGATATASVDAPGPDRVPHVVEPATAPAQPTVGMVVPSLDYYWPDVIKGVREAAAGADVRVVLRGATYEAADELRQLARLVDAVGVDGLLVAPTTTGDEGEALVRWLRSADVPVVMVERTPAEGYREAVESVVSDHPRGAAMAVRHLAERGHRRIGVSTTVTSPTAPHVRRGWLEACARLGLPVEGTPDVCTVDRRDTAWPAALDDLLDACLASGTTALLVHSDPEAISLVERCQERGIRVPGDLAVVTYDDEVAELSDPPLTAIRPPKAAVGRAALELLAARLRDPDPGRPAHRVVIEPRLIVRSSS